MRKVPLRDMVIVLPGILGSVLQYEGRDLWSPNAWAAVHAVVTRGRQLQRLALYGDDPEVDDLGDGIRAVRLVDDAHLLPGLAKIDGYTKLVRLLTDTFQVVPGRGDGDRPANLYLFAYDWRRDCRLAARRLDRLVRVQLPRWREHCGADDARVILLAHSMGGLVARAWLELFEGWRECRALVTFGTPFRGSIKALDFLTRRFPPVLAETAAVFRTCTSIYQLLPVYPVVEMGGAWHRVGELDLPGVDRERARAGLAFHWMLSQAAAVRGDAGSVTMPVVGTRQPTLQSARVVDGRVGTSRDLPGHIDALLGEGDGTVPRLSAVPLELSDLYRETFVAEQHSSLHVNPGVLEDVLQRIRQMQVRGLRAIRGTLPPAVEPVSSIGLDVGDAFPSEEPVTLRAELAGMDGDPGGLVAMVQRCGSTEQPSLVELRQRERDWEVTVPRLEPGVYRVEVRTTKLGAGAPAPVHDLFEVLP